MQSWLSYFIKVISSENMLFNLRLEVCKRYRCEEHPDEESTGSETKTSSTGDKQERQLLCLKHQEPEKPGQGWGKKAARLHLNTQSQGHELRDHLSPWRTCWFTWRAWDYRYKPEEPEKPRDKTVSRNVKNEVSVNHLKRYRDTWGQERGYWMWQLGRC